MWRWVRAPPSECRPHHGVAANGLDGVRVEVNLRQAGSDRRLSCAGPCRLADKIGRVADRLAPAAVSDPRPGRGRRMT